MAHFAYAHVLSDLGRHDEAIAQGAQAIELKRVSTTQRAAGLFLHHARRDDQAIAQLQKTLDRS